MSESIGKRHILTLPSRAFSQESDELFCARVRQHAEDFRNKKLIAALHQVVYISPALEPEKPLPAPWNIVAEPLYFLGQTTNQPVVFNGFVWSSFADGTRHRMQHFVEGADIYGGRPLHIWNGTVYMQSADGSYLICHYRMGRCVAVRGTRPQGPGVI